METLVSILMDAFFIALLIWCSYTDIKERTVPNKVIAVSFCLGIIHLGFMIYTSNTWWTYPVGLVFTVPFLIAWMRNNMGAGDVKLVMAMVFYLGFLNSAIAFTLMVPVLAALMIYSLTRKKTLKLQMPFAPVLTIGALGSTLFQYLHVLIST